MRINVYAEELGEGVELIKTVSRGGKTFLGLRIWLKSPKEILEHSTPDDDDRNAVTFYAAELHTLEALADDIESALARADPKQV